MQNLFYSVFLGLIISSSAIAEIAAFTLTRTSGKTWTAEYCFDSKVSAFKFERPMSGNMRQDFWQVIDEAFELQYEHENNESTATIQ